MSFVKDAWVDAAVNFLRLWMDEIDDLDGRVGGVQVVYSSNKIKLDKDLWERTRVASE